MAQCHVCHTPLRLPKDCNYCGEYYCSEHRLPENHQCPNLDQVHTLGPEFRTEFSQSGETNSTSTWFKIGIVAVLLLVATLLAFALI